MAEISAADVKKLRDATGAGMMDCKKALQEADGDIEKARVILREKGLADAAKRKGREASEGLVHAYLHAPTPGIPPKVGVLLELTCETDFVAKTDDFKTLAQDIALHIAAAKPQWLTSEEVPEDVLTTERELAAKKVEGKPENVVQKATEGAVKKFLAQEVLLEQKWIRDEKQTIRELIDSFAGKIGENISVRRFVRYQVAESLD
ncbi:MAG TPA: translation elongation factor Ts [Actinomycetota bacterium]|jgi:elongation factor Ts|nr:translation elongation factor Ts [Actinomycetota bacterium]